VIIVFAFRIASRSINNSGDSPIMSSATRTLLEPRRKDGKIYSHVRKIWLIDTPGEKVRQEYLCALVNEYGYALEQIAKELSVTGRRSGNAGADFVIWRTSGEREANKLPLIVIECKADNVTIDSKDIRTGRALRAIRSRAVFRHVQ
jgi:type I restriction enzyme M protein